MMLHFGCKNTDRLELLKASPVLTAVLYGDQSVANVHYFQLPENESEIPVNRTANIYLRSQDGLSIKLESNGTEYADATGFVLQPDSTYELFLEDSELNLTLSGEVTMPPAIGQIGSFAENISMGGPIVIGELLWNSLNAAEYSYILKLENLEPVKVEIPQEGVRFESRFAGPQVSASALLYKTDFTYYGQHRLTVYAINRELEGVFFYDSADIRGALKNGPDNVQGGNGFVTGVSSFSIDLTVTN
jgi:hypothetical protein